MTHEAKAVAWGSNIFGGAHAAGGNLRRMSQDPLGDCKGPWDTPLISNGAAQGRGRRGATLPAIILAVATVCAAINHF